MSFSTYMYIHTYIAFVFSPPFFSVFSSSVYLHLLSTTSPSSPFPFSFNTPYETTLFPRRNYAKKKKTMAISSHHTLSHFSLRLFFSFFFSSLLLFFFFFFAFGIACVHFGLKVGRFLRLAPDKSEFPVVRVACD